MKKFYLFILLGIFTASVNGQGLSFNSHETTDLLCCNNSNDIFSAASYTSMIPGKGRIEQRPFGFYGVVQGGGTYAFLNKDKTSLMGVEFIGGYRWSLYSGVGFGIGIYKESEDLHSHIPIFVELRNHFSRNRLSPFSSFNIGYSVPNGRISIPGKLQSGVVKGGALIGFSVGVRYLFTKRAGINLYVGYTGKQETIEEYVPIQENYEALYKNPYFLHQIKFGLGINF